MTCFSYLQYNHYNIDFIYFAVALRKCQPCDHYHKIIHHDHSKTHEKFAVIIEEINLQTKNNLKN